MHLVWWFWKKGEESLHHQNRWSKLSENCAASTEFWTHAHRSLIVDNSKCVCVFAYVKPLLNIVEDTNCNRTHKLITIARHSRRCTIALRVYRLGASTLVLVIRNIHSHNFEIFFVRFRDQQKWRAAHKCRTAESHRSKQNNNHNEFRGYF